MDLEIWFLYVFTCFGISLVPGPNALLVLTHGALHGKRKALFTISGGVLGLIAMLSLCALGLGAVIQASVSLFAFLKLLGGLYLIWLGVSGCNGQLFRQGLLAAVSNPKALLLFTAFIPPFLDPAGNLVIQTIVIALTYAATEFLVEFAVAFAAHRVRPWLARMGQRFNRLCGGFFMIFGAALPFR